MSLEEPVAFVAVGVKQEQFHSVNYWSDEESEHSHLEIVVLMGRIGYF